MPPSPGQYPDQWQWQQPGPPGGWGYGYGQPPQAGPKVHGMAVAAFLCAFLGWWLFGLGSLAGIVLGIVSLQQIKRSNGSLKGNGFAIAGIALGSALFLVIFLGIISSHLGGGG